MLNTSVYLLVALPRMFMSSHDVTLPGGELVHNPLRVVKNSEGSEVIFTLFQRPHMTESEFQSDSELVKKDLQKLKSILEK